MALLTFHWTLLLSDAVRTPGSYGGVVTSFFFFNLMKQNKNNVEAFIEGIISWHSGFTAMVPHHRDFPGT